MKKITLAIMALTISVGLKAIMTSEYVTLTATEAEADTNPILGGPGRGTPPLTDDQRQLCQRILQTIKQQCGMQFVTAETPALNDGMKSE